MRDLMRNVLYTKAYSADEDPVWYSEFCGNYQTFGNLTKDSTPEDYAPILAYVRGLFANRQRDGSTWQTVHSAVYDIPARTLSITTQETDEVYRFKLGLMNEAPAEKKQTQADWAQTDSSSDDYIKNKPTLFSGSYNDLTGKPTLFSGSYDDLSDKPAIPAAQIQADWNQSDSTALDFIKNKPQIGGAGALALIASVTTTEEVEEIEISGFNLTEIVVVMQLKGASTNGTGTTAVASNGVQFYFNGQYTAVQTGTMDQVLPPSGYTGSVESYISGKKLACGYLANFANSYGINTSVKNGIVWFTGEEKNAFPAGIGYANFAQLNLLPKESGWKFGTGSIVAIYGR